MSYNRINNVLKKLSEFKYFRAVLIERNVSKYEINAWLPAGNRCYFDFLKLLCSRVIRIKRPWVISAQGS